MRLPRSIGFDLLHQVQQQRADGIDASTADARDGWSVCTSCGSGTHWLGGIDGHECAVCAIAGWEEWERRGGYTSDVYRDMFFLEDHPRILAAVVAASFAMARESFPRQLCAHCGQPAGYSDPGGWHHLTPAPDCWAPWMTH